MTVVSVLPRHANQQRGAVVFEQRQSASVELRTTPALASERLEEFFVFADDALARDGGDDFERAFAAGLAHPGNDGFIHVERHAFFQAPAQAAAELHRRGAEEFQTAK